MFESPTPDAHPLKIVATGLWVVFAIYLGANQNPKLFSNQTLQAQITQEQKEELIQLVELSKPSISDLEGPTLDLQPPLQTPEGTKASIRFRLETPVASDLGAFLGDQENIQQWWPDLNQGQHFFSANENQKIFSTSDLGPLWSFQLQDGLWAQPWIGANLVILSSSQGQVFALDRKTGKVKWFTDTHRNVHSTFVKNKALYLLQLSDSGTEHRFVRLNLAPKFEVSISAWRVGVPVAEAPLASGNSVFLRTADHKVIAFGLKNLKELWTHQSPYKITSPLSVVEGQVLMGDERNKAVSLELLSGKLKWEQDVTGQVASRFVSVPTFGVLAVLSDSGHLQALDESTGGGKWTYQTHNKSRSQQVSAFRSGSGTIMRAKMKWKHKGWVLTSPCRTRRLCFFNPDKGELVGYINTFGDVHGPPILQDSQNLFLPIKSPIQLPRDLATAAPEGSIQWLHYVPRKPLPRNTNNTQSRGDSSSKDGKQTAKEETKKKKSGWSWF